MAQFSKPRLGAPLTTSSLTTARSLTPTPKLARRVRRRRRRTARRRRRRRTSFFIFLAGGFWFCFLFWMFIWYGEQGLSCADHCWDSSKQTISSTTPRVLFAGFSIVFRHIKLAQEHPWPAPRWSNEALLLDQKAFQMIRKAPIHPQKVWINSR